MAADRVEDTYRRIHSRLWHSLLAYTGNPDIASDAEAEAFSQALRREKDLREIDAWVWRSSFRIAAGMLKDRSRTSLFRRRDDSWEIDSPVVDDVSTAEFLSQLGGLSEQQRAVVVLRYLGGFQPNEIAELLHSTGGSVRVQLHRAHTHLRTELEKSDGR